MLERSACLRPESSGARREEGLGRERKWVDRMATMMYEDEFGGEGCKMKGFFLSLAGGRAHGDVT